MSRTFVVTRNIPYIGSSALIEYPSIPRGSTVTFIGSPEPKHVTVSWKGRNVTILACDFAENTAVVQRAVAARLGS